MVNTTETLDLDILVPEPKPVKFNGKVVLCNIPTMRQLIEVARLQVEVNKMSDEKVILIIDKIKKVLAPIIPEIADDKDFDIKPVQLTRLFSFLMEISMEKRELPEDITDKKK